MQKANINLSVPLYVSDITKLFLSKVLSGKACFFCVCMCIAYICMVFEIRFSLGKMEQEHGAAVEGGSAHLPLPAQGRVAWDVECMDVCGNLFFTLRLSVAHM